jgi:hypothetical protein
MASSPPLNASQSPVVRVSGKVHCDLDDWDFDPRYTSGECPICGWRPPEGTVAEQPKWLTWLDRVQWDFVGLIGLAALLLVLGFLVGSAAGWKMT